MSNERINLARVEKNDEFYTQLEDISNELQHYKNNLKGKIVYCNCDNPEWSNFWKYFKDNFQELELKRLVSTHFSINGEEVYRLDFDGKEEYKTSLKENGDFRSKEAINILKEVDIVITNPPFSLFRDFVKLMIECNKKFLIIGHQNNVTYKDMFYLIKDNKVWLGYGFKGSVGFFINKHYENFAKAKDKKDGMIRVSGVHWFTNLKHNKQTNKLNLNEVYNESNYPKYDGYDCIEVSKTKLIPKDYNGYMGVPISYLDKHNPSEFTICGLNHHEALYPKIGKTLTINGKKIFKRIIIKKNR